MSVVKCLLSVEKGSEMLLLMTMGTWEGWGFDQVWIIGAGQRVVAARYQRAKQTRRTTLNS